MHSHTHKYTLFLSVCVTLVALLSRDWIFFKHDSLPFFIFYWKSPQKGSELQTTCRSKASRVRVSYEIIKMFTGVYVFVCERENVCQCHSSLMEREKNCRLHS